MKSLVILALLVPAAAAAQGSQNDPNERICRVTGETGSRLARNRICKTRAEWEELRREQRNTLDRAQTYQINRTVDGAVHGQ